MARESKDDPLAVDAYLATLPRAERESLEALGTLITGAIPQLEERLSYGTTVMFSLGRDLVAAGPLVAPVVEDCVSTLQERRRP